MRKVKEDGGKDKKEQWMNNGKGSDRQEGKTIKGRQVKAWGGV